MLRSDDALDPMAETGADIAADNVAIRARFMRDVETLTLAEVAARTVSTPDLNDNAEHGRIVRPATFSVPYEGQERHPAFQFAEDGKPLPIIRALLAILPPTMTPWQIAFWFVSSNS